MIRNHYSARLSELDLKMVQAVPPGGNWKDIPISIPSRRLSQIRASFAAGLGSRSTYYGRLAPHRPSYTISTYFNRPGNGCFIHYDSAGQQHRLISQREAARLQAFPDSFIFYGNKLSINKQIGNAVPPLLAYQIARQFGSRGHFVDLFAGAGGLGLGFKWAGWKPVIANELDAKFASTYRANVDDQIIIGDLRNGSVLKKIVETTRKVPRGRKPLIVLGGPPCQGFSTAGKARSMRDERNGLFKKYREVVASIRPDAFLFENVPGILNMQGGKVFEMIRRSLSGTGLNTDVWKLQAEQFAIPQRRTRVFIVGFKNSPIAPPTPIFPSVSSRSALKAISVKDALSDLPRINAGQDGSHLDYLHKPTSAYQKFLRGVISADDFLTKAIPARR